MANTKMTTPQDAPDRGAPVSLHPLSTEQALGALLRTPGKSATKPDADPAKPKSA